MLFFRFLFVIIFLFQTLFAYELYDNKIEEKVWKKGETLLGFLEENMLPLKLYYDLDNDDEKLSSDIKSGTICSIQRDEDYEVRQALIPINEELQIHIYRDKDGSYSLELEPILYQQHDKVLAFSVNQIVSKQIVKESGNFKLSVEFEKIFREVFDFKKLKLHDKIVIFYKDKVRLGKFYGTQEIKAAIIQHSKKRYYLFRTKNGKYYDQYAKGVEKDSFIVPCKYRRISSNFTLKRWHPILHRYRAHHGIDYAGPVGTPIHAAYDGKVIFMGRRGGYGNAIIIKHKNGYKTLYGHLSRFNSSVRGRFVKKGTIIGYLGNTGLSTGPHLHFGLSFHNTWIDPSLKIVIRGGLTGVKKKDFLKLVKEYQVKMEKILRRI